jgi:CDP-paratose 2-epimerase
MFKNILVTGGAGFVGSHLCRRLKRAYPAAKVTAFDNLRRRGSEWNLPELKAAGIDFVHGDVRDKSDLESLSPDLIIECSAEPSAQAGYNGSADYLVQTNLMGCYNCLELAKQRRAHFVFLSTSRVYPYPALNQLDIVEDESRFRLTDEQKLPGVTSRGIAEQFPLDGARSLYGMTKLAAELMIQEYGDAFQIPFVINRFGLLTGPGQMAKSDQGVIALWVAAHLFERKLAYIGFGGTGKQVRDFLHIDDAGDLILDQLDDFDKFQGQVWNVGGGVRHSVSLLELTRWCQEVTGKKIAIGSDAVTRPADVKCYVTDHSKVSAVNGWQPKMDLLACVSDIGTWYTDRRDAVAKLLL